MKEYFQRIICIGSSLILLPIFILYLSGITPGSMAKENSADEIELETQQQDDVIREETLIGILAREIPYTYEKEAVKAQAVIERTYMARRILGIQKKGAVVGYTEDEMRSLWGEDYEKIYDFYRQAVQETRGKMILYNDQPIEAVYHGASSGRTRDAMTVYHVEVPYLKGVESTVDTIRSQIVYNKKEIVRRLKSKYSELAVDPAELQDQIQIVQKDEAGYVLMLQIGNITVTGEDMIRLLKLPSCAFKIYDDGEKLIFDVKGSGNGVGLSQNGANELAKQGADCDQIIKHYYTGVKIGEYEFQK